MPAYRAIRIHTPDRPGALSAISSALAAHQVDIVRLDVVSHEGATVVDDLVLAAAGQEDIGRAIGSFYPEVSVRTFDEVTGDPALQMGASLGAIAASSTIGGARESLLQGALHVSRADDAVLLRATQGRAFERISATGSAPGIGGSEPFSGRWVLERRAAAAFPVAGGWAPQAFQHTLSASWVAIAPAGALDLLVVSRRLNIPFYMGELERLATFAEAASAIIAALGDRPAFAALPAMPGTALPPRAVTLAGRLPIR